MRQKSYRRTKPLGKEALVIAVIILIVNALVTYFAAPMPRLEGELGICLPSANLWTINPLISFILNNAVYLAIGILLIFYNRIFDIVKDPGNCFSAVFLIMVSSIPWLLFRLNSATIMVAVNFVCIWILSTTYKRENTTQDFFLIATMLSIGAMIQYAFVFMIPAYILAALTTKAFRLKEAIAFFLGIIAPYWTSVGLGIISPFDFRLPTLTNLFTGYASSSDIFVVLLNLGITTVIDLMLMFNIIVRLYAGNSKILATYNIFNIIGFAAAVCIIMDFNNLMAYIPTLYLMSSLQVTYMFSLWMPKRPLIPFLLIAALYLSSFFLII